MFKAMVNKFKYTMCQNESARLEDFNAAAVYIELCEPGDFETEFVLGKVVGKEARCPPGGWFNGLSTCTL